MISLGGAQPYYLERRGTKVLAIEGPLESDLPALADRIWRRSTFEPNVPWVPIDFGTGALTPVTCRAAFHHENGAATIRRAVLAHELFELKHFFVDVRRDAAYRGLGLGGGRSQRPTEVRAAIRNPRRKSCDPHSP